MTEHRFYVVTGMHRSHTSLLGRMLVESGMTFHDSLVGDDPTNPYGHFEDIDLMQLHEDALRSVGSRWYRRIRNVYMFDAEHRARARKLVAARTRELGPGWGFKVPHSTLFLEEWAAYEGSRFLLIFRRPSLVLSSMFRRMGWHFYARPDAVLSMTRAYAIYNERIAEFRQRYPDQAYLIDSNDLLTDPKRVLADASEHLDMDLEIDWAKGDLVDKEITSAKPQALENLATQRLAKTPRVQQAYQRLRKLADSHRVVAEEVRGRRH